ncbi:cellulose biosynthesis cyclic di-GMP-binding regulatory protein BcsB [Martelella limonii]|uniref:cellulose biosynthesis cyclic di-GMP-binding regulatory protein BcsB n=1 Tax=Martelella limonii TaxID=1647649 RepID=UPI0015806103|nr:cellulose biosynthesis cyclic di-GMP-binding regulatory protein BcsB [Martelella limonii]
MNKTALMASLGLSLPLLIAQGGLEAARAGAIADQLQALAGNDVITRKVSLADLGMTEPLALSSSAATRNIYIPVPAGVALIAPTLSFDGSYLRADGGTTTYVLSLDGYAVAARSPEDERGESRLELGVDGTPRDNGFVNLGIEWSSATGQFYCDDARPIGNQLLVQPDTYLEYSFDAGDVTTVASAYAALPQTVTLLVGGNALEQDSYDAAWRLGVALERTGKMVEIVTLPAIGDTVDVTGLNVPAALQAIPAFAALAGAETVKIEDAAEVGALLLLGGSIGKADVAVAGSGLTQAIDAALKALSTEVTAADPDAQQAFEALAASRVSLTTPLAPGAVSVVRIGGKPVIAVAPDGASEAAGMFSTIWRKSAVSGNMIVKSAQPPVIDGDTVPLTSLGNAGGNLDVVSRGDWSTTFDLGSDIPAGKVPTAFNLNVSAAPGATDTRPVASVFINGTLLGAKQLRADGTPENISVAVPAYTLQPRNTIVVRFQRQPASDHCREVPQGYPVSVLPGSSIRLGPAPKPDDFGTIAPSLAGDSTVVVAAGWLENAALTLPGLIDIANASGISPEKAAFAVAETATIAVPETPFLFLGVGVEGGRERARIEGDTITITTDKDTSLFDASGLDGVAVLSAETGGKQPGLVYQTSGAGPMIEKPILLGRGDVAVIGASGVLSEVNTSGRTPPVDKTTDRLSQEDHGFSLRLLTSSDFWLHQVPGMLTAAIIGAFVLLILLARSARRRHRDDKS